MSYQRVVVMRQFQNSFKKWGGLANIGGGFSSLASIAPQLLNRILSNSNV